MSSANSASSAASGRSSSTKRAKRTAKGAIQQHFRPALHNRDGSADLPTDVFELIALAMLPGTTQVKTVIALGQTCKTAAEGAAGALNHVLGRIESARARLQAAQDAELDPLRAELAAVPEARVEERRAAGFIQPMPSQGDGLRLEATYRATRRTMRTFRWIRDAQEGMELSEELAAAIAAATEAGDAEPWNKKEESKAARLAYARVLEEYEVPMHRRGHAVLFGGSAPPLRTHRQLLSMLLSRCDNCGAFTERNQGANNLWPRFAPLNLFACEFCYRDAHAFIESGPTDRAERSPTATVCRELWVRCKTADGGKLVNIACAHDARVGTATAPTRALARGAKVLSGRAGMGTRMHEVKAHVGACISLDLEHHYGVHLWVGECLQAHLQLALAPELARFGATALLFGDAPKAATAAGAALRAELADAVDQFARAAAARADARERKVEQRAEAVHFKAEVRATARAALTAWGNKNVHQRFLPVGFDYDEFRWRDVFKPREALPIALQLDPALELAHTVTASTSLTSGTIREVCAASRADKARVLARIDAFVNEIFTKTVACDGAYKYFMLMTLRSLANRCGGGDGAAPKTADEVVSLVHFSYSTPVTIKVVNAMQPPGSLQELHVEVALDVEGAPRAAWPKRLRRLDVLDVIQNKFAPRLARVQLADFVDKENNTVKTKKFVKLLSAWANGNDPWLRTVVRCKLHMHRASVHDEPYGVIGARCPDWPAPAPAPASASASASS